MASAQPVIDVRIAGLRDARGRFASMRDRGLVKEQERAAAELAAAAAALYRRHAPRSKDAHGGEHFADTIEGRAHVVRTGFQVMVDTPKSYLRELLKHGTGSVGDGTHRGQGPDGEIVPKAQDDPRARLRWTAGGAEIFARMVKGMKANPWEERAAAEASPLIADAGNKIGRAIVRGLEGK